MSFKSLLFLGFIFTVSNTADAQTSKPGRVGVVFSSFSSNDIIYFGDVAGSGSYSGKSFYSLGVNYIYPLKTWLEMEAAVEYSKFTVEVTPPFYPDSNNNPYNTEISTLNIPVSLRTNFSSYFYVNGGVLFEIDISDSSSIDNQSGIGGIFGIGAEYGFDFGASIFINPYLKIHTVIPFSQEGSIQQRLLESAIRIGITYQLERT